MSAQTVTSQFPLVMHVLIRPYRPSDRDTVLTLFSNSGHELIRPCFYNAMSSPLYIAITLALSLFIVHFPLVMHVLIRPYRPSDRDTVLTLFSNGTLEHIRPCFYNAMSSPLYIAITLALCVAGYLLGSVLGAVVLPGAWVGLVYYCCHEIYAGYVKTKLQTDMRDILGNFMSRSDDCFWVVEAEVDGRAQIMGTVAVVAKQSGKEKHGELFRMIISSSYRRLGLGSKMTQTVVDFCKERGFSKVVLETSSTQAAAVALYKKLWFRHAPSQMETERSAWMLVLARVTRVVMEKHL